MVIFTVQKLSDHTCLSFLPLLTPMTWLHRCCAFSLHRKTLINKEKGPVYISPIKQLLNSQAWGGEKLSEVRYEKDKKRQKWKKENPKVLQDDSVDAKREWRGGKGVRRGRDTGEALCLGHRRTHSLNNLMEWNSRKVSHHWAPLFHHSSPFSLISCKIFQLADVFQMFCSLAAAEQLLTLS